MIDIKSNITKFFKKKLFDSIRKHKEVFPKILSIEFTSACNAKCIMCPQPEMDRKKENMSFEVLDKIISDCKKKPLKKINLFWMGDSTVDKKMIEKIRIIRKELPKVKLYLSTNAQLLGEKRSRILLDEDLLDVINFDIDGLTKSTFEGIRVKLDFDVVTTNVKYFLKYKKSLKKKYPQTRVTIIDMKPTKDEVEKFVSYWKNFADKVDVNHYNTWGGTQDELNYDDSHNKTKHQDKLKQSQNEKFDFACTHPWEEMVIGADGRVGLCCLDHELNEQVGDIKKSSLQDIWQGDVINEYRNKQLRLDYQSIGSCKNCNAHTYQKDKLWAKLQKA
jgi:radical SAM protein with 4Fe4S-binding SPASM domain